MSKNDFLLSINKEGAARVHRTSCGRIPATFESLPLSEAEASVLAEATLASCCKPRGAQVYVDEAGSTPPEERTYADPVPEGFTYEDTTNSTPLEKVLGSLETGEEPAQDPTYEDLIGSTPTGEEGHRVHATDYRISKHYWPVFGEEMARAVATRHGTTVEWDDGVAVYPETAAGSQAAGELTALWVSGWATFRRWRRADEDYKSLPSQDVRWYTSARYLWEREWLRNYGLGYLDSPEAAEDTTPAAAHGYTAGQEVVL